MASPPDIRAKVNRGLAWIAAASSMVWTLDVIGTLIVLAVWIEPSALGVAALAIPYFPAFDLAVELGLGAAIVQHDDHSEAKLNTVFWMNLLLGVFMAAVLAGVVGPALAWVHDEPMVWGLFALYAVKLPWHSAFVVPRALLHREFRYKELSIIRVVSNVAEFAAKIGFAAAGFGIWCLVLAPIARVVVHGLGVQYCRPWRPRWIFRPRETFGWAKFGLKSSGSQIFYHLYTNLDYQVVYYYFGATANGLYMFAYEVVLKPCQLIGQTLRPIAFSAYSRLKHAPGKLAAQFTSFARLSLVVMLAFVSVVFVAADDIGSIWEAKGAPATDALRLLCGVGLLRALSVTVPPLLDGAGRAGLTLVYSTTASVVLPLSFVASAILLGDQVGFLSVPLAWLVGYPIPFALLLWFALRVLEMRLLDLLRQVMGIVGCAALGVGVGFGVRFFVEPLPPSGRLLLSGGASLLVFLITLAYFQKISPRTVMRSLKGEPVDASAEVAVEKGDQVV